MSRMKQNRTESSDSASTNNQKAWDTAVDCLQNHVPDIQAIPKVYAALIPPSSLTTLADIMAAVYADVYWTGIKMDPDRLSSSLQQNGWNIADSDKAAKQAFSQWRGLLVRGNMADNGYIPGTGVLTDSPDAIVANRPINHEKLINRWNHYFRGSGNIGKNICYGRARSCNMGVKIKEAKAHMYTYQASLNSPPPTSWQRLYTQDHKDTTPLYGMENQPAAPGERVASDEFIWHNAVGGNYCILHIPSTEFFTNDPTRVPGGNWNQTEWLANNGAAGLLSIAVPSPKGEDSLRFYNHDAIPEKFIFEAHCSKVPDGTEVTLECDDRGLPNEIITRPMKTTSRYHLISTPLVQLPPYFEGELNVRIKTPGNKPLPADASVEVRMIWILHHSHPHYEQAAELLGAYRDGAARRPVRLQIGNFTFVGKND